MKWIFSSSFFPQENFKLWNSEWNWRALGQYAQRWNDNVDSLALEPTILMIFRLWVFPSLPPIHFFLSNVLDPVGKCTMFSAGWNEFKVMKFCQLKFRRKKLSRCWDTAHFYESSCVTRKGTQWLVQQWVVLKYRSQHFGGWTMGRFLLENWSEANSHWAVSSMRVRLVASFSQGVPNS